MEVTKLEDRDRSLTCTPILLTVPLGSIVRANQNKDRPVTHEMMRATADGERINKSKSGQQNGSSKFSELTVHNR